MMRQKAGLSRVIDEREAEAAENYAYLRHYEKRRKYFCIDRVKLKEDLLVIEFAQEHADDEEEAAKLKAKAE